MIKLYKDENKNNKIKEVVADLRKTQRPFHSSIIYLMKKYGGL